MPPLELTIVDSILVPRSQFKVWSKRILDHVTFERNFEKSPKKKVLFSRLKYEMPPLWPNYVSEKRTTLCKVHLIKVWWYWEHFGMVKLLTCNNTT
jgi:hypothetical protein